MDKNNYILMSTLVGGLVSTIVVNYLANRRREKYQIESLKSNLANNPIMQKFRNNINESLNNIDSFDTTIE